MKLKLKNRKGSIDQIIVFVLLTPLVFLLLFEFLKYFQILEVGSDIKNMSYYASRTKALNKDNSLIASNLNTMKSNIFKTINEEDINCYTDYTELDYKVIFKITGSYKGYDFNSIYTTYNENSPYNISCELNLESE